MNNAFLVITGTQGKSMSVLMHFTLVFLYIDKSMFYINRSNGFCYRECNGRYLVRDALFGFFGVSNLSDNFSHCMFLVTTKPHKTISLKIEKAMNINCSVWKLIKYNYHFQLNDSLFMLLILFLIVSLYKLFFNLISSL